MANSSPKNALKASARPARGLYVKRRASRLKERGDRQREEWWRYRGIEGDKGRQSTRKEGNRRCGEVWHLRSGALTCVPQHLTCPQPSPLAVN